MSDLDQYVLHEIAFSPERTFEKKGVTYCIVEQDLLQRVARGFDLADVREAIRGKHCR